jgi:hypothetical protein
MKSEAIVAFIANRKKGSEKRGQVHFPAAFGRPRWEKGVRYIFPRPSSVATSASRLTRAG